MYRSVSEQKWLPVLRLGKRALENLALFLSNPGRNNASFLLNIFSSQTDVLFYLLNAKR